MEVIDCGLVNYREMWDRQLFHFNLMVNARKESKPMPDEQLLLVEHPHVYTLGKHGDANNLLLSEATLKKRGAEVFRIERGGDITYHGPGQLVVYPLMDLQTRHLGIKEYIHRLEECVIRTIAHYGIVGERVEGATGVWIGKGTPQERKICAIGVKCSRFVTMHGLALNVNTDLGMFGAINPCGFVDKGVTSISAELPGKEIDMKEVKQIFTEIFLELFPVFVG